MADERPPERLAWPLRLDPTTGRLATVEQDSDEDIAQCIRAIVRTRLGGRPDLPDMGVPDPTFEEQPIDTDAAREQIERHEPRVAVLATTNPDALDAALADLNFTWERAPGAEPDTEG